MIIILDSDVIIESLRGNETVISSLKKHYQGGASISFTAISVAEIYAGVRQHEEKAVQNFFLNLNFISFTEDMGIKAGEYLRTFQKTHGIGIADALIAACTVLTKASLMTLNAKHYPMRDVRIINIDN
jgi:predicted nucleic acid-binding protein